LQSKLIISTKVYHAQIDFLNGGSSTITLVKKDIGLYDSDNATLGNKDYILIEDIPKDFSIDSNVTFVTKAVPLSGNNIFQISLSDKELSYYTINDVSGENLKLTSTLLIPTSLQSKNSISGFSIFGSINFSDFNYFYLVLVLFFVIILFRIMAMFGLFDKIKQKFGFGEREYHAIMMLINDAKDYLDVNDVEKAALVYKEIKLTYESVSSGIRAKVYDQILELCSKIDEGYMRKLVQIANDDLRNKDKVHAVSVYGLMQSTYKKLREASKDLFEGEVKNIYKKISGSE